MSKNRFIGISLITAVFFVAVFVFVQCMQKDQTDIETSSVLPNAEVPATTTTIGLIVPHHDPVSFLTQDALKEVSLKPDLIILIGPNHFEAGSQPILTGRYNSSHLGRAPVFATAEMNELVQMKVALQDDAVITHEHAIGVPLPFLQEKFASTPILPLVLKYHQSPRDIQRFVQALETLSRDKNILIVGSIDFSHYISSDIAPLRDAEMKQYIAKKDYQKIATLSNEYLDSPWSLITLLQYLGKNGVTEERLIAETNTGLVAGTSIESSTSFLTYIFE